MKKLSIVVLAVVASVAVSCGGGGSAVSEPYNISFDVSGIDRSAPFPTLSEMVDEIEYVKLEYAPDYPVGDVDDLAVGEDNLLIYDNDWGVFHYTRDGRFVQMISSRGRGPGEYLGVTGLYIDEAGGVFCLAAGDKLLRFEIATGDLLSETTVTEADGSTARGTVGGMTLSGDVVLSVNPGFSMGLRPQDGPFYQYSTLDLAAARVLHREPSRLYNETTVAGDKITMSTVAWHIPRGGVTVYENGDGTMYAVGPDLVATPRIVPDFGGGKIVPPVAMNQAAGTIVIGARETGDHILFDLWEGTLFSDETRSHTMSFDKRTGERALAPENDYPFGGPANDIDGGFSYLKGGIRGVWWESYDAFRMIELLTDEHFERVRGEVKFPDRMEKLQAFVETLTEDDNPVLAIARVKK